MKFEGLKKLVKSKLFLLIVLVVVVLYVVVFPHTKSTKVNAELTGVFVTQKEQYLLHTQVGFKTEFVCVIGSVVKSQDISYRLNGDIKSISIKNCDGSGSNVSYNSNGTMKSMNGLTYVGASIQILSREYSKYGLLELEEREVNGTFTQKTNTYYDDNTMKDSTTVTDQFGVKAFEQVLEYDVKGVMTDKNSKTYVNGEVDEETTVTYVKGAVNTINYTDDENNTVASITCTATGCILDDLSTDDYELEYNNVSLDYDILVNGATTASKITFTPIFEFNIDSVLDEIKTKAQVLIDAL